MPEHGKSSGRNNSHNCLETSFVEIEMVFYYQNFFDQL
jgi:hypothetical protein